jgi:hypothetical protein
MPGIMCLYTNEAKVNKVGMKVKEVYYRDVNNRKSIIESWIILYGDRIDSMYVHIIPKTENQR